MNIVVSEFEMHTNHVPIIFAFTSLSENILFLRYIHEKVWVTDVRDHGMFSILFQILKGHLIHDHEQKLLNKLHTDTIYVL